jgi:hypothetical protein
MRPYPMDNSMKSRLLGRTLGEWEVTSVGLETSLCAMDLSPSGLS